MFGNFNCSTRAGGEFNEDAIYYHENLLIVMDAATSLNKLHLTPEGSDGCWLSKYAVAMLAKRLENAETTISDALHEVARELKQQLDEFGYWKNSDSYPSASIMIVRSVDDSVELFSVGDCTAIVEFANERQEMLIHDDAVTMLDNTVIASLIEMQQQNGKPIAELLPQVKEMLVANRNKRNTEDGYWAFDPTGAAIEHGTLHIFPKNEISAVALMSDGFYCISSLKELSDPAQLMYALKQYHADMLIDEIFEKLAADSLFNQYPRFKLKDDASVIYAELF